MFEKIPPHSLIQNIYRILRRIYMLISWYKGLAAMGKINGSAPTFLNCSQTVLRCFKLLVLLVQESV